MVITVCRNDRCRYLCLMAIVFGEPEAGACIAALKAEDNVLISAGSLAESLIVSARRNVAAELAELVHGLGFQVVSVTPASARRIAQAYHEWGKGVHPAGLNFGDCFAYEVAKTQGCRLLYVGDDFAKTDIASVL